MTDEGGRRKGPWGLVAAMGGLVGAMGAAVAVWWWTKGPGVSPPDPPSGGAEPGGDADAGEGRPEGGGEGDGPGGADVEPASGDSCGDVDPCANVDPCSNADPCANTTMTCDSGPTCTSSGAAVVLPLVLTARLLPRSSGDAGVRRARPTIPARCGRAAIRGYRRWVSPRTGTRCRYVPSCSAYGMEAVGRYGLAAGSRMALSRIRRCTGDVEAGTVDRVP